MKLDQLHAIAQEKLASVKMMVALEFLHDKGLYGHVYAGSVDPVVKASRRVKNKAARKARAVNRKRG